MVGYVVKDKLKRAFSIMMIIITFAFMIVLVTGCDNNQSEDVPEEVVKKTYSVVFDSNGGSEVDSQTITEGESVTKPISPTKEGYEFVSWTYNGSSYSFSSPVTQDMTLVAEWAKKEEVWVVTLDSDNGNLTRKINVKKGEKLEKPENPEKEGYDFVSWQLDGKDYDFTKVVEKDITLKATWKEKKLKVTFDSAGGSTVATQEVSINGVAKVPKNPTKNGWTFVAWQLEGKNYDFKAEVKNDITLVATWKLSQTYQKEMTITKKINKKDVKLDFRYLSKKYVVDVFANDIKIDNIKIAELENDISYVNDIIFEDIKKHSVGIIKGDKEYLYIDYGEAFDADAWGHLNIINDTGKVIYIGDLPVDLLYDGFALEKSCPNYDKFLVGENLENHAYNIETDAIYYLSKVAAEYQLSEYKMTIKNNNITTSKVAVCLASTVQQGGAHSDYDIIKTQKVNNKNVELEYRFGIRDNIYLGEDGNLPLVTASLYINNKLIIEDVFESDLLATDENYEKLTHLDFNEENMTYAYNYWQGLANKLDKTFGVIKGDKEYLYIKSYNESPTGTGSMIHVLNSSNTPIFSSTVVLSGGGLSIDKLCPNLNLFTNGTSDIRSLDNRAVISNNKIYYFKAGNTSDLNLEEHQGFFADEEIEAFDQYQVEFKNDKAVETKVATCAGYHEGAV